MLPDTEARIEAAQGYRIQLLEAIKLILIHLGLAKTEEEAKMIVKKDREIFEKYCRLS
jgi:putative component of toxin-antitoxin plasmid stabilization module